MTISINKTIKVNKGEITISRDGNKMKIQFIDCSSNAVNNNKVVTEVSTEIDRIFDRANLNLGTFEEAISNIEYAHNIRDTLVGLKEQSCQRFGSKVLDNLKEYLHKIPQTIKSAISNSKKYTYAEKLVLSDIRDVGMYSMYWHDLSDYYSVKTMKLSPKFKEFVDSVNNFDYKKYDSSKETLTKEFNELVVGFTNGVKEFEGLVKEHGDDLINWGSHKLSRRNVVNPVSRSFVQQYQEILKKKGVTEKVKTKNNALEKTREKSDKAQEDYFRLFKSGTMAEAKGALGHLSHEQLLSLITNTSKSLESKIRDNREAIQKAFCDLDDGSNLRKVLSFKGHYSVEATYYFKVIQNYPTAQNIKMVQETSRGLWYSSLVPDFFFDLVIKPLPEKEILGHSNLFADAYMQRLTDDEKVNIFHRMAGHLGVFMSVGLEVPSDEKLEALFSKNAINNLSAKVYQEIKDFIPEIRRFQDKFDELVVANQDKEKALELFWAELGKSETLLGMIFSFEEKLTVLKEVIAKEQPVKRSLGRELRFPIEKVFTEEEEVKVFKALLRIKHRNITSYLSTLWDRLTSWDKRNDLRKKEFEKLLATIPNEYAPVCSSMSKDTRKFLLFNGVDDSERAVEGFTRQDFFDCKLTLSHIKSYNPKLLTTEEVIEFGEKDESFLKKNISLFPKDYLKKKFDSPDKIKGFIGNRTHRENRWAHEKLMSKIAA